MSLTPKQRAYLAARANELTPPDRTWLPNNKASIKQFQSFHHLAPDGIVGPRTRAKMQQVNTTLGDPPIRTGGGPARRSMAAANPGYGAGGNSPYKPIEDERGGQAESTAYDRQAAAYYAKRRGTAQYSKGKNRPD